MHPAQVAEYAVASAIVERRENNNPDVKKIRIVCGVHRAAEIVHQVTSGEQNPPYAGETFKINLPFKTTFVSAPRPQIISCSMGPQMFRIDVRHVFARQGPIWPCALNA